MKNQSSFLYLFLFISIFGIIDATAQVCNPPSAIASTKIHQLDVTLTWATAPSADGYLLRGKEVDAVNLIYIYVAGNIGERRIINLNPFTTYEWQVQTICVAGLDSSSWSDMDSFTTKCLDPISISTTNITPNSATLSFVPSFAAAAYKIVGRKVGGNNVKQLLLPQGTTQVTVNNLVPSTTYEWTVKTICDPAGGNTTSFKPAQTFTTLGIAIAEKTHFSINRDLSLEIAPNPNNGQFFVTLGDLQNLTYYCVHDLSGKEVLAEQLVEQAEIKISINHPGVYILSVREGNQVSQHKVVVL